MTLELRFQNSKLVVFDLLPKQADELHGHDYAYQISIPISGQCFVQHNQTIRKVNPQSGVVLSPGALHRHEAGNEPVRMLIIELKREFLTHFAEEPTISTSSDLEFLPWREVMPLQYVKLAKNAFHRFLSQPMVGLELQEFEWTLGQLLFSSPASSHTHLQAPVTLSVDNPAVRHALEYIHSKYTTEISLDQISMVAGFSKYHFLRIFREYLGVTPGEYVRSLRLTHAKELLLKTKIDLTSIALESGFQSLSSFDRVFRKQYGMNPSAYRALHSI